MTRKQNQISMLVGWIFAAIKTDDQQNNLAFLESLLLSTPAMLI